MWGSVHLSGLDKHSCCANLILISGIGPISWPPEQAGSGSECVGVSFLLSMSRFRPRVHGETTNSAAPSGTGAGREDGALTPRGLADKIHFAPSLLPAMHR